MTNVQKIQIRLSEVRERLNDISGLEGEALTDEIRLRPRLSILSTRTWSSATDPPRLRRARKRPRPSPSPPKTPRRGKGKLFARKLGFPITWPLR